MTLRNTLRNSSLTLAAGLLSTGMASADIVHLDDVIIEFSLCVGNDCVNGENFGFDTLRIKENNVRVHFDDTSSSASFPSNDWRLIANDSSNGGANYLGIEDSTAGRIPFRVEAGAPVNALYVESDGDVGIKTANPVVDLHIVEGNTPTMRLEQDGSDGFTPQTWDVAGNESNFFIRDVTNGSKLSFRIQPNAPESSIWIANTGNIGFGTSTPSADANLHVRDATRAEIHLQDADGGEEMQLEKDGDVFNITFDASGDAEMRIQRGGNVEVRQGGLGFNQVAAPANTSGLSGGVLFVDTADGDLKVRFANNTVVTLAAN